MNPFTIAKYLIPAMLLLGAGWKALSLAKEFGIAEQAVKTAEVQSKLDAAKLELQVLRTQHAQALATEAAQRAELAVRLARTQGELADVQATAARQVAQARAAADAAARSATDRLRDTTAAIRAGAAATSGDPAALASCKAETRTLTTLLDTCGAEYQQLAADADAELDAARDAGLLAERSYDAAAKALKEANP